MKIVETIIDVFIKDKKLFAILLLALVIRITWLILYPEQKSEFADGLYYNQYAVGMLENPDWIFHDYQTFDNTRPPVYPLFAAVIYSVFGKENFTAVYVFQAFVGMLTVLLVFLLSYKIFNKKIAYLSALWYALYLPVVRYTSQFARESLIFLFLLAFIYYLFLHFYENKKKIGNLFYSATFYVLLIHTDPRYLFYLPFMIILFFTFFSIKKTIINYSLYTLIVIALMMPWLIRNYIVYEGPVIIDAKYLDLREKKDNENVLFFMERSAKSGTVGMKESIKPNLITESERKLIKQGMNPKNRSEDEIKAVVNDIYPDSTYWGRRIYMFEQFWQPTMFEGKFSPYPAGNFIKYSIQHNLINLFCYGVLLPFFIFAMIRSLIRREKKSFVLILPIIIQTLIHTFVWSRERYRHPVDALIIILGVFGIVTLYELIKKAKTKGNI